MDQETYFYSILQSKCSCRQKNGELRNIGRLYRDYYQKIVSGERNVEILSTIDDGDNSIGLPRMCCRSRFLSIPIVPMIDRSKDRIYDDRKGEAIRKNTPKIEPGYMPYDFPATDASLSEKVIPPSVNIEGELPGDF